MSTTTTFEVKIQQLDGGRSIVTTVNAANDYYARQLIKLQYGTAVKSVHYVREMK